jgi:hypothetical protein
VTDLRRVFTTREDTFTERVLPLHHKNRGILTSEGFAFCALADALDVDVVIESGIYLGKSTEIWCRYFQGSTTEVIAMDVKLLPGALSVLEPYDVDLQECDSMQELPRLVDALSGKKMALFIDGPKDMNGKRMAADLLKRPGVQMVGMHDIHRVSRRRSNPSRAWFDAWDCDKFATDEDWFVKRFCYLDLKDTSWDAEQKVRWIPYELVTHRNNGERALGSYGPTIGIGFAEGVL